VQIRDGCCARATQPTHNSPRAGDRRRHPLCGFTPRRHFKLMRPGMASEAIPAAVGTKALKPLANTTYESTTDGIREGVQVVGAWRKGTDYVLNSEQCCTRWGISDITSAMVLLFWLRICEVRDHVCGQGKLRLFLLSTQKLRVRYGHPTHCVGAVVCFNVGVRRPPRNGPMRWPFCSPSDDTRMRRKFALLCVGDRKAEIGPSSLRYTTQPLRQ
jgi:hypothetical protein